MTREEYKKLFIETLDTGWSYDYADAVGHTSGNSARGETFRENTKILLEYQMEVGKFLPFDILFEITTEDNPYHYKNPSTLELMGSFIQPFDMVDGYDKYGFKFDNNTGD